MEKFSLKKARATIKRIFHRKLVILALVILALGSISYAVARIYWSRTITYSFSVYGIDAELLVPTGDGYHNKAIATALDANNRISLTIIAENFYNIWLNITWTSNSQGLAVAATGQYWTYYYSHLAANPEYNPTGSPFDVLGYHVIDKTQMMYHGGFDVNGGLLMITFSFDTELVTIPGSYQAHLLFEMGFV